MELPGRGDEGSEVDAVSVPASGNGGLRVLMLAPTPYFADRGCHVRIYEEARALRALGHDVRIVTYHLGRDLPGIPTWRIPSVPWYGKLAAGPSWHKPYLDLLLLWKAWRVGRSFRPQLIHAHLHEGVFIGSFLKRLLGIPLLFDCQGSMTAEMADHGFMAPASLTGRAFARLERLLDHAADFIITSSTPAAEELTGRWGVASQRVLPLLDAVDTEVFAPGDGDGARRSLGIPVGVPLAVYLGVLNRYQGVDLLLEAAAMLERDGSPLHLLVMGYPQEEYRRRASETGLAGRIHFTGRVEYGNVPRLLAAADMAVSPKISRTEANGKLFNYLACGLPTVVFDTTVNREIMGEAGVYVPYGDAAALAVALDGLARDPGRRWQLAAEGRRIACQRHSWETRGNELQDIYRQLLDRGKC
jgi:glycosyltransferase involved in cell wall biosynthesis